MVFHTIKKRIRLCKMEEVLSLGWLKWSKVPARDFRCAGPGTQPGHVSELLVKRSRDGTAINVWVADQELGIWKKTIKKNWELRYKWKSYWYYSFFCELKSRTEVFPSLSQLLSNNFWVKIVDTYWAIPTLQALFYEFYMDLLINPNSILIIEFIIILIL